MGDIMRVLDRDYWDLVILHPDCTCVTVSGNSTYAEGKPGWKKRLAAAKWFERLWNLARARVPLVAIEQPVTVIPGLTNVGKPSQVIQPYQFGHDASKQTCLYLRGLPKLEGTKYIEPRIVDGKKRWGNQTDSGQNRLGPSPTRAMDRARTYPGSLRGARGDRQAAHTSQHARHRH